MNEEFENRAYSVKMGYADFLQKFPWDYYSTVTFRHPRHDALYWSKRVYEVFEKFDCTRAFVAVEPHKYDGIHIHALTRHLPLLDTTGALWKYCFKAFGRTQIEPIDGILPVSRYCAKYVVKENSFSFMGEPSAWKLDC